MTRYLSHSSRVNYFLDVRTHTHAVSSALPLFLRRVRLALLVPKRRFAAQHPTTSTGQSSASHQKRHLICMPSFALTSKSNHPLAESGCIRQPTVACRSVRELCELCHGVNLSKFACTRCRSCILWLVSFVTLTHFIQNFDSKQIQG